MRTTGLSNIIQMLLIRQRLRSRLLPQNAIGLLLQRLFSVQALENVEWYSAGASIWQGTLGQLSFLCWADRSTIHESVFIRRTSIPESTQIPSFLPIPPIAIVAEKIGVPLVHRTPI